VPRAFLDALNDIAIPSATFEHLRPFYVKEGTLPDSEGFYDFKRNEITLSPRVIESPNADFRNEIVMHELAHHALAHDPRLLYSYPPTRGETREDLSAIIGRQEGGADRLGLLFKRDIEQGTPYSRDAAKILRLSDVSPDDLPAALWDARVRDYNPFTRDEPPKTSYPFTPELAKPIRIDRAYLVRKALRQRIWANAYLEGLQGIGIPKTPGLDLVPKSEAMIRDFAESLR
jgi:hypothetical protein